jgi:ribonucleoside-diphosphate reductase alpha chain
MVPDNVRQAFEADRQYFPTPIQHFQFVDKYARFNYEEGRRETWVETVDRATQFLRELSENRLGAYTYERIRKGILTMQVFPSMRLLATAGEAARRNNISIYNCAACGINSVDAFVEALIISMNGCGFGYSVESRFTNLLPVVARQQRLAVDHFVVMDTSESWADAYRYGLNTWFAGDDVTFDLSLIRPAGSPLRTKGGRASGPEPLRQLLEYARAVILNAQNRQLTPLEVHDIVTKSADAGVLGGHRRAAMLSLYDWRDDTMRFAKAGDISGHENRWNANNSEVWPDRFLSLEEVSQFMCDMDSTQRGEPGIFNRSALNATRPARREAYPFITNPCGEIALLDGQFCNLSQAICRADDTFDSLANKVEIATIIGTIQSMGTYFPGLRPQWKENCEKERLLGVDLNGQLDCYSVQNADTLSDLRYLAKETNERYARRLGIAPAAAITCCKPAGNSALLASCSSGIHARWSPYQIRNVRVSIQSPVGKVLAATGAPMTQINDTTAVVPFPICAPEGSQTRHDRSAIVQLEYWLLNKLHWTEHNPSVTITYSPDELSAIIAWVHEHQSVIGGISFLPRFDALYDHMPNVEITKEEYVQRVAAFPTIDWSLLYLFEDEDLTEAAQTLACAAGVCEI